MTEPGDDSWYYQDKDIDVDHYLNQMDLFDEEEGNGFDEDPELEALLEKEF